MTDRSEESVLASFKTLMKEQKPFRILPPMKNSLYYCDREFKSKALHLLWKKRGHTFKYASSSLHKSYLAER